MPDFVELEKAMLERPAETFTITVARELPADWPGINSLGTARAHVFQTREFLGVWAEVFAAPWGVEAYYVEVRDAAGALVMRLPLAIEVKKGVRVLGFADQSAADYVAPILYPTTVAWSRAQAEALWAQIEAALPAADLVVLEKMPALVGDCINPFFAMLAEANPESCHGSDVTRPWAEIEATQAQLKTLRRKARGLEKLGAVRFIVASDAGERQRLLARLMEQKQRRFEDTQVPGFAEVPEPKLFFERATEVFAATGNLHLAALEVGGELVATSWTLAFGSRVYELMIGFESGEWAKHSPGRVLNLRYLEWAKAQGFAYVDHGIGDEDWKRENCDTHVPLGRLVAARSAKGRRALAKAALVARVRATRLYRQLRPYKWIVKRAVKRRLGLAA
jgi:CelD/BcsL family acetyltransferase involved in cellulose biosynthesis